MTFPEYLAQWSRLHGHAQPTGIIWAWLRVAYFVATPLTRFSPNSISYFGAFLGLVAVLIAPRQSLLAAFVIVAVGLIDNVDGIVAVRTNRVSELGSFIDSMADRWVDIAVALVLLQLNAPLALVMSALLTTLILEYMRARAQSLGVHEISVVSIGEKPTRIIIGFLVLVFTALNPSVSHWQWPNQQHVWSAIGAAAWTVVGFIAAAQVFVAMKKQLQKG